MHGGLVAQHAHGCSKTGLHDRATGDANLVHVAWAATAFDRSLIQQPLPARWLPQLRAIVATVIHKLDKLRPTHHLRINLELWHLHLMRRSLVVKRESAVLRPTLPATQLPARGGKQQRFALGHWARCAQAQRQAQRLPHVNQGLAMHVLMKQGEAVKIQRIVVIRRFFQQLQADFQRVQHIGLDAVQVRQFKRPSAVMGHLGRVPQAVGPRFNGSKAGRRRVASASEMALQIACNPPFLKPANMPQLPQRWIEFGPHRHLTLARPQRLLILRQQVQGVVACVHQRQ